MSARVGLWPRVGGAERCWRDDVLFLIYSREHLFADKSTVYSQIND